MAINLNTFLKTDIWLLSDHERSGLNAFFIKILKISLLAYQGFTKDICTLRASALTLYTLLAVVPVIAMLFGIAKGFGLETLLQQQLLEQVPHQDTTILKLISFAQNLLESTKSEVVAGIGVVVLLWSVIHMISNIEEAFNYIWKINKGRTLTRKLSDYLSLMLLAPVLLILSSSITVFLNTKITWLATVITLPKFSEGLLLGLLSYSPLLLMVGLFATTFIFMPNHKINFKAGIIAGIVTGILYHLLQWLYLSLQIGVSSYNAVYGSFAALPLFVVWVQTAWMVVLFGCEIAFYIQNYESHRHNYQSTEFSFAFKKIMALQISHLIIKNFIKSGKPLTAEDIALALFTSVAVVQELLDLLVMSHLLIELKTEEDEEVYLPAVDINILSIAYIINALEHCGQNSLPNIKPEKLYVNLLNNLGKWSESSEQNRLLKDI
ncbi:MAG: YihY/virulence factor BrkB family protein [Methylococcales bacterium]